MTQTQTLTPTDFLAARFTEDEAVAQNPPNTVVHGNGGWHQEQTWLSWKIDEHTCDERSGPLLHIDPARVLAEVEAKRQIIAHLQSAREDEARGLRALERLGPDDREAGEEHLAAMRVRQAAECIVGHLAAAYSDHPDFREEWRA